VHRASAASVGALAGAAADAVRVINDKVSEALVGMDPQQQVQIDQAIMDLDKARHKVGYSEILSLFLSFAVFLLLNSALSIHYTNKQLMAQYAQAILYIGCSQFRVSM
jgi:hypothetical protein